MLKKRRERIVSEVRERLGPAGLAKLEDGANSFGVESGGAFQWRGNGCLGTSSDDILFIMWWPRREIHINRKDVSAVDRARSHLGKTIGRDLLRVRFTNPEGAADSVAWWVSDLDGWEEVLRHA